MTLFIGPEGYSRGICRRALIEKIFGADEPADGYTRYDLDDSTLGAVLDDARSFSLFAPTRLIWVGGAESALPKRLTAEPDGENTADLAGYLRNPTPGVTIVLDVSRYDFDGEDKARLDRVTKFFAAVPEVVEFRPHTPETARRVAQDLARAKGLQIGAAEIGLLVDSTGADASRIAADIEKLSLYAGTGRKVSADDLRALTPNAQASTIFALVNALGRGDRKRSLETLDVLVREGEYLPLALSFLAVQFRLALTAQEAGLRSPQQIQAHFTKQGIRVWRDRAEAIYGTLSAFSPKRLGEAIEKVYWADKGLRDTRPDDRTIVEELILSLTGSESVA